MFMSQLGPALRAKFGEKYANPQQGFFSALIRAAVSDGSVVASHIGTPATRVWLKPVQSETVVSELSALLPPHVSRSDVMRVEDVGRSRVYPAEWDSNFAQANLGPFPNFRPEMLKTLGRMVDGKRTALAVVLDATDQVRLDVAGQDAKRVERKEKSQWVGAGATERFLRTLLGRNAVLEDASGAPFKLTTDTAFTQVASIADDFVEQFETSLLLQLIQKHSDFGMNDISAAAVFLFGKRNPRDTGRITELIGILVQEKRVVATGEAWVVAQVPSPNLRQDINGA